MIVSILIPMDVVFEVAGVYSGDTGFFVNFGERFS